ncbi:MAG: hypothetical protein M1834_005549 [Cirrosporium novae-zelandiae]|nr:MAG: hypothetical protein M1834_005549 [Cirrosporium novae-zelandiae]
MVHADASDFPEGVSKKDALDQVLQAAGALFEDQRNWVCNLANSASLLWHAFKSLPSPSNQVNWAGFYVLDPTTPNQLILGPFQGKVACQIIPFGKGVCGNAASQGQTQLVKNVLEYPGHIACDGDTVSEIVVPILNNSTVVGVIDIDCTALNGFDNVDKEALENLALLLGKSCDW